MTAVEVKRFSKKQLRTLSWWLPHTAAASHDAIICDGAVRSGKTLALTLSFLMWAMFTFDRSSFGLCGKTIGALRRNVITPVLPLLREMGFFAEELVSKNRLKVTFCGHENDFFLFSGKDEGSAALIQGMTLSGVLFDEAALMPRSFVEQACARCSVEGSRFFFNCNPAYPAHWFYQEWIRKRGEKNALYIHFEMKDNPSLTKEMLTRYENLYSGAFYRRFVKGEWVSVSGAVYPFMEDAAAFEPVPKGAFDEFLISCDYGTVNPCSFGLWGRQGGTWYRIDEYYYDARREGGCRTDAEHFEGLKRLAGGRNITAVVIDPSARSFSETVKRDGRFFVAAADNNVIDGIRRTSDALKKREVVICDTCADAIREFSLYRWDESKNFDTVVKENDHAMDDIRYFVGYIKSDDGGAAAVAAERN